MPQPRLYESNAKRQAALRKRKEQARIDSLAQKGLPILPVVSTMPGKVRWRAAAQSACQLLQIIVDEMQEYHDDRSDVWQESDRAEMHLDTQSQIQDCLDQLTGIAI